MKEIILLKDYLNRFGSKHDDYPYRSGMDKEKLKQYFDQFELKAIFLSFDEINFRKSDFVGYPVVYTSQEDLNYKYKSYIEDVVYGLELSGAKVIPAFKYLKANNNKIFMEIIRDQLNIPEIKNIRSYHFGTLEDAMSKVESLDSPLVVKGAEGAMSKNVKLATNKKELYKALKQIAATKNIKYEFKDYLRQKKHKGYRRESKFRNKFIIQNYVPHLSHDWKIYVFGDHFFIFKRPVVNKNSFKASGGGYDNYYYGKDAELPSGIFDFAQKIFREMDTPFVSLDVAYDYKTHEFFLLEFQLIYFGTAGILKKYSNEYFYKGKNKWVAIENHGDIEYEYAYAVNHYLKKQNIK